MTSSDDRRRPRVAGQRRRHGRAVGEPVDTASSQVGEGLDVDEAPVDEAVTAPAEPTVAPPAEVAEEVTEVLPAADDHAPEADGDRAPEATDTADDDAPPRVLTVRDLVAPLVALVVALALLAAVCVVGLRDHGARERDARAATAAATAALQQLLSYDYRTIAEQADRNAALLTGQFRTEYAGTMAETIAPMAQKEKTVVQARSSEAGVMGQTPDTVTVEVFVDQAKTSEGDEQPSVDQNRVIATMQRVGDRWLISKLSAF